MTKADIAARVETILAEATLAEKVAMMSGNGFFSAFREDEGVWGARPYRAGSGLERLDLAPLYFTDGPRGVVRGQSTCFPCTMARGASFDVDLERRIGEAMGIEARAQGCTLSGAVCINLLRHPAWGRAQETYGEDPHHLGAMGSALGTGIQAHGVIATVKHFALNSMENARFVVDVRVDERTLHEIYLPHFKACLDAGVASVMSAYNRVNGDYCGHNRVLLTDILRSEWGFDGFVHSDWIMGVYGPDGAAAGLDIENPEPLRWGAKLVAAVADGTIEPHVIDTACRRILRTQLRFAAAEPPLANYPPALVASEAHLALALEAAEKSAVLLENDGSLPLAAGIRLALLGQLATLENTGDNGSSRVRAPRVVTALAGLIAAFGADKVRHAEEDDLDACASAAAGADAVIVVVGYTAEDEGEFIPSDLALGQAGSLANLPPELIEARKAAPPRPVAIGGDRLDLRLPQSQVALIETAAASGKPVIVVIVAGSAVLVEPWRDRANAILQTFYSGMEGGTALARLLLGAVSPSGKLPFTVARDARDYPAFDRDATTIDYDYWHGYAKFEHEQLTPRYPFGHGLSYARFTYRALTVRRSGDIIDVSVAVRNDGTTEASEIVHTYVAFPGTVCPRALKSLKAFARVTLAPGETRLVPMTIAVDDLRYRDPATHDWRMEMGSHEILVGGGSAGPFLSEAIAL
ncbi:MAG: glycoside hydrolase family 3 C-terminal domain-containing protein [Sphingomonas bacterium]|nr:glycoside hydrolase family 3 C-terminal domain-containing protein [Sphingomonas bacterium]